MVFGLICFKECLGILLIIINGLVFLKVLILWIVIVVLLYFGFEVLEIVIMFGKCLVNFCDIFVIGVFVSFLLFIFVIELDNVVFFWVLYFIIIILFNNLVFFFKNIFKDVFLFIGIFWIKYFI